MKTTTILKTLALAMLMPTMLLTIACSNNDNEIVNTEQPANTKGYALPATVNVTRQGGDATRATYDESTRKLSFSTGDKLYVAGIYDGYQNTFAGLLTWQSGGTFSGTIMTQTEYSGTAAERLASADFSYAVLMPAGYTDYGYLSIDNEGAYDANLSENFSKAFALTKKVAVEQFSRETAEYDNGFALAPINAILNFTISGLAANTEVAVCFKDTEDEDATPVNVKTNAEGVATFAVGMDKNKLFESYSLTVDGTAIALPAGIILEAGTIYNISRKFTDLSTLTADYEAKNGETLTGTLASNVKISIADGATVTLKNVNITNLGDNCDWAGIECSGNATLVLEGTNEVCAGRDGEGCNYYPGIYIAPDKTLTIQGDGTLTAYSHASDPCGAGIGGGNEIDCGNIVINSGTITATGGNGAAGIGGGNGSTCGNITINGGTITATGGPFAAGIGGGYENGSCGTITIKSTVTSVTATKGEDAPNSIGAGDGGVAITVNIEAGANVIQN